MVSSVQRYRGVLYGAALVISLISIAIMQDTERGDPVMMVTLLVSGIALVVGMALLLLSHIRGAADIFRIGMLTALMLSLLGVSVTENLYGFILIVVCFSAFFIDAAVLMKGVREKITLISAGNIITAFASIFLIIVQTDNLYYAGEYQISPYPYSKGTLISMANAGIVTAVFMTGMTALLQMVIGVLMLVEWNKSESFFGGIAAGVFALLSVGSLYYLGLICSSPVLGVYSIMLGVIAIIMMAYSVVELCAREGIACST